MKVVRRRFLQWGLFSSVAAGLPTLTEAKELEERFDEPLRTKKLSIIQGATDESHTQFSVLHPADEELYYHVITDEGAKTPDYVELIPGPDHPQSLSKVYFSGLPEKGVHLLRLMNAFQEERDSREFKMLRGKQDKVKFAVASCMDDAHHEPHIWKEMIHQEPEIIIFAGDSVYADKSRAGGNRAAALDLIDQHRGFVWIVNGSQMVPAMLFKESMSGDHPVNFEAFMEELKSRRNRVAFISGDVHFSEISKIEKELLGYKTYEFTSSSIHSKAIPGVPDIVPNKRRIEGAGKRNFLLFKTKLNLDTMEIEVTSYSKKGRKNFEKNYKV